MGKDKAEKINLLGGGEHDPHKVLARSIKSMVSYHQDFKSMIASLMCADLFFRATMQINVPIEGRSVNLKEYLEEGKYGLDYSKIKSFLKKQIDNDLPYITTSGIVKLFSYLEETIRSLIISIFKIEGNIEKIPIFEKVKLSIHDYLKYEPDEFYELLYSKYQEQIQIIGKNEKEDKYSGYGIERYERQLKHLGLSGKVDKKDKENIYQLIQLRHCIVHRDSMIDSEFIEKCPQLNFKVGDEVSISVEMFSEYQSSVYKYLLSIISRLKASVES